MPFRQKRIFSGMDRTPPFRRKKSCFVGTGLFRSGPRLDLQMHLIKADRDGSRFPLFYEIAVWMVYTALYKYVFFIERARLPNKDFDDFPHLQLLLYALAMTLYVIPFYRWIVPVFFARGKHGWLIPVTIAWFLFVAKLSNFFVSNIFNWINGPGIYKAFYAREAEIYAHRLSRLTGWDLKILLTDLIAFGSVALMKFAFENERRKRRLEKENLQLQQHVLQSQLNPHFLFNTLNSIYGMSLAANKDTPEYVLRLADMMRYILYDCREGKVPLEKDIAFTENYVAMEMKRYPGADIRFTVSRDNKDTRIAPLLLIPFVENSFKHGAHRFNDSGFIHADLRVANDVLQFVVANDIFVVPGLQQKEAGGIGIENARKRLELSYPGKHVLFIDNTGSKYKVSLTIILNNKE